MNKLSRDQLKHVEQQLQKSNPHQALQAELLDHIASLTEQRMDQGQPFLDAFDQIMQQASPQALAQLKQLYLREFSIRALPASQTALRVKLRLKRRPTTKPFQYMFLSTVLTFLILMGFLLVVSRPMAIPIGAFHTAWGAGLAACMSVLVVRWWLARKSRKPKQLLTA